MKKACYKTPYDTNPVESLQEAIVSFTAAFDGIQKALTASEIEENMILAKNLKETLYKPVYPKNEAAPVSVFEFGIMYVPLAPKRESNSLVTTESHPTSTDSENVLTPEYNYGTYSVNNEKLSLALGARMSDIKALFVQCDGLICDMVRQLEKIPDCDDENVVQAISTMLNECFRLRAMF